MGIFYNPPQPPSANNAGTPPEPHVPIGNQGTSVPPSRAAMFAVTMAVLVSAWPADLEPRLTRPNDQQTKIAPLTLPSGQQPPRFSIAARMAQAVTAWPADLEPRLGYPNERQRNVATLTLRTGAQPPPIAPLASAELFPIVASWQQTWDAQRSPKSLAWNLPISPYLAHTPPPQSIWTAWEPAPLPPPRPVAIAPLTLTYGAQPTPQSPLSTVELDQIHRTWIQSWNAQTAPESAAWNIPPIVQAFVPSARFRYDILASTQDPLTILLVQSFVVGQSSTDEPPRQSALSLANQAIVQQAWAPAPVTPQAPRSTTAWNIPPVISTLVPRTPPPALIWTAWVEPFIRPPAPVAIAPLTLPTGQAPPPQFALSVSHLLRIAGTWAETWGTQSAPNSASWNVPPLLTVLPHVAPPSLIWTAWEPPYIAPPRPVSIATLTLVYGSQPAIQPPLARTVAGIIIPSWPPDLEPRLGRPNTERVRIATLTLVYGNPPAPHGPMSPTQLRLLTGAWEPPWHIAAFYLHGNYVPGSFVPPPPPTGVALVLSDAAVTLIDVSDDAVTTLTVTDVLLFSA